MLLATLGLSANALNVASLGLQVTGNNIANANSPGYIRQRLIQSPGPTYRYGNLLLGTGVKVDGIVQVIDRYLGERMRNATSDLSGADAQAEAYGQLESILNELGDSDLSTSLTSFFGAIHDILNQPESTSVRGVAVQQGRALTDAIRRMDSQVRGVHQDVNRQIAGTADEINKLLEEVAKLNLQIVQMEGGSAIPSDAVGLRDRRNEALARLSEITDIRTIEQIEGDVVVYTGGEFLVSLGTAREVQVVTTIEDGLEVSEIRVVDTDGPITTGGGRLGGLMAARDEVVKGFLNDLDEFTQALIYEFNKVYSGGQGLSGYSELASEHAVSDPAVALDAAGLPFTPVNGLFQVQVYNTQTSQPRTTDIRVDLNGLAADTTLNDLAAQIDAIDGISASVTAAGKLQITADSAQISFAFAGDTSGVLAALGVNTFFSGTDASDIGVSDIVRGDPRKFAMSAGGIAEDTENGERLATLLTSPLASYGDASLAALYDALTGSVALGADTTRGAAEGLRHYQQALEGEHLAISGVNLDEEAVRMIAYQRAFQASAKVIATVNEMLETLLNL